MALTVVEETIEKEITFLEDVDPEFVSLVRHGANRMPWRIVKEEKKEEKQVEGGGEKMMIVQAILATKGVQVQSLSQEEGLGWLSEARLDSPKKFEGYSKFEQAPVAKFEKESLSLVKVHESGVWALAGQLKKGETPERAIALGEAPAAQQKQSMMDTEVSIPHTTSFRNIFWDELDSMVSTVMGLMNQSVPEPKSRKKAVMGAVDAFRAFLELSLDSLGGESAKLEKREKAGGPDSPAREEKEEMGLFATKEEFAVAIAEAVMKATSPEKLVEQMTNMATQMTKMAEQMAGMGVKAEMAELVVSDPTGPDFKAMQESLAALTEGFKDLKVKWEKSPATAPAGEEGEDTAPATQKDEKGSKKSVFSGFFLKQAV